MALSQQERNFLADLTTLADALIEQRFELVRLRERYDLNDFGNATTGITDADLTDDPDFAHLNNNELLLAMQAVDTLITAFGNGDGNSAAGKLTTLNP